MRLLQAPSVRSQGAPPRTRPGWHSPEVPSRGLANDAQETPATAAYVHSERRRCAPGPRQPQQPQQHQRGHGGRARTGNPHTGKINRAEPVGRSGSAPQPKRPRPKGKFRPQGLTQAARLEPAPPLPQAHLLRTRTRPMPEIGHVLARLRPRTRAPAHLVLDTSLLNPSRAHASLPITWGRAPKALPPCQSLSSFDSCGTPDPSFTLMTWPSSLGSNLFQPQIQDFSSHSTRPRPHAMI